MSTAPELLHNTSMPVDVLVPVLAYPSVGEAVDWLCRAFGFGVRWQAGEHRAQLSAGDTAGFAVTEGAVADGADHVMVRVSDVDTHRARAIIAGADAGPAETHAYGERQYTAHDYAGRAWVFSQSVADVDPATWGARTR